MAVNHRMALSHRMALNNRVAVVLVGCLLLLHTATAICPQTCLSDMECKGFVAVNDLVYCWKNCCSSYDTVVGSSRLTLDCIGNVEGWTSSDASAYPWLAYMITQTPSTCNTCVATLISPEWIVTDFNCQNPIAGNVNNAITNVYFYYDDPHRRQIYKAIDSYTGTGLPRIVNFVKIQYIGQPGKQIPITPPPINCNTNLAPTSATIFYWNKGTPLGTRTFSTYNVDLQTPTFCSTVISSAWDWVDMPNSYYCVKGQAVNDYFYASVVDLFQGAPLLTQDASGAWLYIGSGMNAQRQFPAPPNLGNCTTFMMSAAAMTSTPNMQTLFGSTCA